jgi:hypothetical protein
VTLLNWQFIPEAIVEISKDEIDALFKASESHYDSVCRAQSKPGGMLWGLRNQAEDGKCEAHLSTGKLNLLAKISENLGHLLDQGVSREMIRDMQCGPDSLIAIMRRLNDEYRKINS